MNKRFGQSPSSVQKSPLWQVGIRHTKKPNGERALARNVRARETQL